MDVINSFKTKITAVLYSLVLLVTLSCNYTYAIQSDTYPFNIYDIPEFNGKPSVMVNKNTPYFEQPASTKAYKRYKPLDDMGRATQCEVLCGKEFSPKGKRKNIGWVYPTGWEQKKYKFISGKNLYNRCHLIGYQIAGDNADGRNLITGTRYLNVDGMLPYENKVAKYIQNTKNHVLYRVTPLFIDDEMVARGVLMECTSIEDNKLRFNVFCYNVQPGIYINYVDGGSIQVDPLIGLKTIFNNIGKGEE